MRVSVHFSKVASDLKKPVPSSTEFTQLTKSIAFTSYAMYLCIKVSFPCEITSTPMVATWTGKPGKNWRVPVWTKSGILIIWDIYTKY